MNVYRVLSNYNLISGSSDEGCWRSENGHNSMHFEKKTKIKEKKTKKKDLVIYSLNYKSMVKQPHLNTFSYIVTILFLKLQNLI